MLLLAEKQEDVHRTWRSTDDGTTLHEFPSQAWAPMACGFDITQ